jgi:hypothetical protein
MGLIKTAFKTAVAVKTAHVVHDRIQQRKQDQWVAQGHPAETFPGLLGAGGGAPAADQAAVPSGQPGGAMVDVLAQLRELADLRAQGALTDVEFEAQKERILAQ